MKTGLTKREKVLIFIAISALMCFAAFRFAIEPLNTHYAAKSTEHEMLTQEAEKMELMLQSERVIRGNHSNSEAVFKGIELMYPSVMPNEEIDRVLTGLCTQNGLNPVALRMNDAVDFKAVQQNDGQDSSDEVARGAAFSTVKATMLLNGDYNALKRLISAIDKVDYIRIGQVSFVYADDSERSGASNLSATFELTMRNPEPEPETETAAE